MPFVSVIPDSLTECAGIPTSMKATPFEGGVRGLGFVTGAGLAASVRGTVQHGLMHGALGNRPAKHSCPRYCCNVYFTSFDVTNTNKLTN